MSEHGMRILDLRQMLAQPPPPIEWAWDGIAARGSLTMLFGAGKTANSFLAMEFILRALTGGGTLLGRHVSPAHWALIIDAENGKRRLTQRLWEFGVPDGVKDRLHVVGAVGANLADERSYTWMAQHIARIRSVGPGIILFDSVTALRDVRVSDVRALIRPQDTGILIQDENGEGCMSGSRDWRIDADAGLRLEKVVAEDGQAYIRATLDFSRDAEDGMVVGCVEVDE